MFRHYDSASVQCSRLLADKQPFAGMSRDEYTQILLSAAITGPLTWPIAAELIARQQGNRTYTFRSAVRSGGLRAAFAGCAAYSSYKLFGIGAQRGVQTPVS